MRAHKNPSKKKPKDCIFRWETSLQKDLSSEIDRIEQISKEFSILVFYSLSLTLAQREEQKKKEGFFPSSNLQRRDFAFFLGIL